MTQNFPLGNLSLDFLLSFHSLVIFYDDDCMYFDLIAHHLDLLLYKLYIGINWFSPCFLKETSKVYNNLFKKPKKNGRAKKQK